ncbi:hypothetical protein LO772_08020 [Yinghuangia sp. ASG 101]|uniref:ABC-three component system protein n=1 Tax=Yinghuangia sp. ASG 101 TaxID=2896848 RepID=UPI001E326934|nr:ABC-three component system protein [Yinghuangia sp. ASG 101]UGQ13540.1 hypothetical protein LO772_08020 [Yinghuangia sp. ASG 101]
MAQTGSHSAAGQMTGYLYQCELALLELADRSWEEDPSVEVRMEVLDDIEFLRDESQDPFELLQSKHRGDAGQLSETGKDFWRSVASWIDALTTLGCLVGGSMPLLRLVSTQVAAEGTFLHMLRPGPGRRVDVALARMIDVAEAPEPKTTAPDRRRFLDLPQTQRYRLVDAIEVCDGAPLMSDMDRRLTRALGINRGQDSSSILAEIKGWWYGVAVELLERKNPNRRRASVSAEELLCRLDEVKDRFAVRNLPITESLRRLTDAEIAGYEDDLVVAQMRWVGLRDRAIATHLRDYHHARAQRSEWLRTFKITEAGLEEYEQRLRYEWDHVFARHTDVVDAETPEPERTAIGARVLNDTLDRAADEPARPGSATAAWIGRGTMHSLADRAAHTSVAEEAVGWHPDFVELCEKRHRVRGE